MSSSIIEMNAKAQNEGKVEITELAPDPETALNITHPDIVRGEGEHEGIGIRDSGHGLLYHLKLCVLFLLRGMQIDGDVSMTAEYKRLNPFDDIVIMTDIGGCKTYHLLQLKHAQARERSKKIASKDLLKEKANNWKDHFTLQKYFKGYLEIKKMPEFGSARTNFMVFTNIDMNHEELKEQCISIKPWEDAHFTELIRESKGKCYKLQSKGKSRIFEALVKGISGIPDDDVKTFIEDFVFAVNLPDEVALSDILKNEIGTMFNSVNTDLHKSELQDKLMEWLKQRTGSWLTREDAKRCFKDLKDAINSLASRGLDISGKLCERNTLVIGEHLSIINGVIATFLESKDQLLQVVTESSYLTLVKIHQLIDQGNLVCNGQIVPKREVIFTRYKNFSSKESREYIQSAMKSKTGHKLLIVHIKAKDKASRNIFKCLYKMSEICTDKNKKMILISEKKIDVSELEDENSDLSSRKEEDNAVTFLQLTEDTQSILLSRNLVTFLGNEDKTSLSLLVDCRSTERRCEVAKTIDSDTLVRLIKHKELKIGTIPQETQVLSDIYLDRKLKIDKKEVTVVEEELLRLDGKVVIIHAEAGMGKSALLNSLCRKLRLEHHLWLWRINLNNYTKLFNEELEKNRAFDSHKVAETIDFFVEVLLESSPDTKLQTPFEKKLLKLALKGYMNVALVFDAFDEICPNYKELVTSLLSSLQETSLKKLYVTSRPVGKSRRIKLDGGVYFRLVPLSRDDQHKFVTDYCTTGLGSVDEKADRAIRAITAEMMKQKKWTLLEIPLILFLFAEYLKDSVSDVFNKLRSNCQSQSEEYSIKEWYLRVSDLDDIELIKYFILKKFKIYQIDKGKQIVGNISSDNKNSFFMNELQKVHTHLALEAIFDQSTAENLMGEGQLTDPFLRVELPKVGLVYETSEGYYFLHSAFTEYYVIVYISVNSRRVASHLDTKAWEAFMRKMDCSRWDRALEYIIRGWFNSCIPEVRDPGRLRYVCSYLALVRRFRHMTTKQFTGDEGPEIDPETRKELLAVGLVEESRPSPRKWAGLRFVYWRLGEHFIKDYAKNRRYEALVDVSKYYHSTRLQKYMG